VAVGDANNDDKEDDDDKEAVGKMKPESDVEGADGDWVDFSTGAVGRHLSVICEESMADWSRSLVDLTEVRLDTAVGLLTWLSMMSRALFDLK